MGDTPGNSHPLETRKMPTAQTRTSQSERDLGGGSGCIISIKMETQIFSEYLKEHRRLFAVCVSNWWVNNADDGRMRSALIKSVWRVQRCRSKSSGGWIQAIEIRLTVHQENNFSQPDNYSVVVTLLCVLNPSHVPFEEEMDTVIFPILSYSIT